MATTFVTTRPVETQKGIKSLFEGFFAPTCRVLGVDDQQDVVKIYVHFPNQVDVNDINSFFQLCHPLMCSLWKGRQWSFIDIDIDRQPRDKPPGFFRRMHVLATP